MIRKTFFTKVTCCLLVLSVVLGIISCKKAVSGKDSSSGVMPGIFSDTLFQHKVVFQTQWLHQAQFAGFYVAYEKGLYKDYGIDVTIEMGGPENPSAEALVNKKADIVSMFLTTALREVDEGNRLVNLAQIGQKSSMLLVSKKSSGIQKVDDMNHKRVGLWKNDFMEPSLIFLRKYNINCQIVPVSWTTNVLAEDVVDAMNMMYYNEYNIFVLSGYDPTELTVFPLADYGVNIPEDGIYCLDEFYISNPRLCHDFAEASKDGWIYALNHEEETLAIVISYLKKSHLPANIPHQRWMLKKIREAVLYKPQQYGKLTGEDYNSSVNMMETNNIIGYALPYNEFIGYAE